MQRPAETRVTLQRSHPPLDISDGERVRLNEGQEYLKEINTYLSEYGADTLSVGLVDGDGYCLFRSIGWAVLGDDSAERAREIYAYALSAFLKDHDAHAAFPNNADERGLRSLMVVADYCSTLHTRTALEMSVLSKFEAILQETLVLDTHLYGDAYEFMSLLTALRLQVLRLDVTGNANHVLLPSGQRLESSSVIAECLLSQRIDAVMLHWSEADYEHYCIALRSDTGAPWSSAGPESRANTLEKLRSAPLCCALRDRLEGERSVEEVRACILSALPGPS
jgi:hypothetical protein